MHGLHPDLDIRTGHPKTTCGLVIVPRHPRPLLVGDRPDCPICLARISGDPNWRQARGSRPGRKRYQPPGVPMGENGPVFVQAGICGLRRQALFWCDRPPGHAGECLGAQAEKKGDLEVEK